MLTTFLLIALIALPFVGGMTLLWLRDRQGMARGVALGTAALVVALVAIVAAHVLTGEGGSSQPLLSRTLIATFALPLSGTIRFELLLGVDSLSLPFVLSTALALALAVLLEVGHPGGDRRRLPLYFAAAAPLFGLFLSFDALLFVLFWELSLLPLLLLDRAVGREGRSWRGEALIKGFISSSLLLIVVMAAALSSDLEAGGGVARSLDLLTLGRPGAMVGGGLVSSAPSELGGASGGRLILGIVMLIALALRYPVVPLHRPFVRATERGESSALPLIVAGTIAAAGYALFRLAPTLVPDVASLPATRGALFGLGGVGVLYGGLCAYGERSPGGVVGYLGTLFAALPLLGFATAGITGLTGALMLLALQPLLLTLVHLAGTGGGESGAPSRLALAGQLAAPGLAGWWGTVMILLALFGVGGSTIWGSLSLVGLLVALAALVRLYLPGQERSVVSEQVRDRSLDTAKLLPILPILVLLLVIGLWPAPFVELAATAAAHVAAALQRGSAVTATALLH